MIQTLISEICTLDSPQLFSESLNLLYKKAPLLRGFFLQSNGFAITIFKMIL